MTVELAEEVAASAGLHYVTDTRPGISRERDGDTFSYRDPRGKLITDERTLARIRALGIPPAYTDVWICTDPRGHLQATGRDARGRKQYRYHASWRTTRDETKFGRMVAFGLALPQIRAGVEADLRRHGLPREKVLATVVRLLEVTLIRVGNDEYARLNKSYGLTTMRDRHVQVKPNSLTFAFRGKSGKHHQIQLRDRRLTAIVKRCRDLPGQDLFQYLDEDGQPQTISSADVNAYLRALSGEDFTAKDFRTWAGTVLAAKLLRACEPGLSAPESKRRLVQAIESVSAQLGNTPSVCRKSYVHPAVIDAYLDGSLVATLEQRGEELLADADGLDEDERAVLQFLRARPEVLIERAA